MVEDLLSQERKNEETELKILLIWVMDMMKPTLL